MDTAQINAPEADEAEVILLNKPLTWTSFDAVNKRELELGAATMASLVFLFDQYGID